MITSYKKLFRIESSSYSAEIQYINVYKCELSKYNWICTCNTLKFTACKDPGILLNKVSKGNLNLRGAIFCISARKINSRSMQSNLQKWTENNKSREKTPQIGLKTKKSSIGARIQIPRELYCSRILIPSL